MKALATPWLSNGLDERFHCQVKNYMAQRTSLFNSCINGDFRCYSLVATDGCCVYHVGAANDTDGIFIQTAQLQKGGDGFMRYRPKGIGEI